MKRDLKRLSDTQFDLLIIGGGIQGAGIAWRASLEGMSVALIDKGDFASGSSSNTSKVIYGGMQELRQYGIKRSRHAMHERLRLMHLAPHLVQHLNCIVPIYSDENKTSTGMKAALKLYDWLGRKQNRELDEEDAAHAAEPLEAAQVEEIIPGVDKDGLKGGARWQEAVCSNTERLVIAMLKTASARGAALANYVRARKIITKKGRVCAVAVRDELSGVTFEIQADEIVDCTGPWTEEISTDLAEKKKKSKQNYVAGINIVTRQIISSDHCVYLRRSTHSDQFYNVIPWRDRSLIGTEWFRYEGHPDHLEISRGQCLQLIENFNRIYPHAQLSLADVSFIYKGLVPGSGEDYFGTEPLSKFRFLDYSQHGVKGLTRIVGVEFGSALHVAEAYLMRLFPRIKRRPLSDQGVIAGGLPAGLEEYREDLFKRWKERVSKNELERLFINYGNETEQVLVRAENSNGRATGRIDSRAIMFAEVRHALSEEMAVKLTDVVMRRTDLGSHQRPSEIELSDIADQMASVLQWSENRCVSELTECRDRYPFMYN